MELNQSLTAKHTSKRGGTVQFIVLHDTAGSGSVNDAKYLANPGDGRNVSVDFVVLKTGEIYQLNHDLKGRCTYHAGRATSFRGFHNAQVNNSSVGIEISQFADIRKAGTPAYPDLQVKAVADLCKFLCNQFKLERDDITTHAKIITDHSRTDPRNFPWDSFWSHFEGNDPGPQPEAPVSNVTYHTVVAGDTLYALANFYNTSIEHIKALNGINLASNEIIVGQTLLIHKNER